jgi:hypothetical protein
MNERWHKGRAGWSSAMSIRKRAGHGYRVVDVSRLLRSKQRLMGQWVESKQML